MIQFKHFKSLWIFSLACFFPLVSFETSPGKRKAIYNSLDPKSISQHLAFYKLYSEFPEGKQSYRDACALLSQKATFELEALPDLLPAIDGIISLVNKRSDSENIELKDSELEVIEQLALGLHNRKLKGYKAHSEEEVLSLPSEEIDLARGILLTQLGNDNKTIRMRRSYEAMIDLMALQILSKLSPTDTPTQKVHALNNYIFYEMGFRFPPHSLYAKDIDLYTFLPTVLDSRKGVCLGVSILYLCLAQRINLSLEMITPPGHIYVRCPVADGVINIETTARGIHIDSKEYLGIDTCTLQQRTIKEVIGLAHFNQASIYWENKLYDKALESYSKAEKYLPNDPLLMELMGYNFLLVGEKEKGEELLKKIEKHDPEFTLTRETIPEDYLNGNADAKCIEALFMRVDETRESILKKKNALEEVLQQYPKFRGGLFALAGTWLQLHRQGEALQVLQKYHDLDPFHPSVEYFLAALYASRFDGNRSWDHLRQVEKILHSKDHHPEALRELRNELSTKCPEYRKAEPMNGFSSKCSPPSSCEVKNM